MTWHQINTRRISLQMCLFWNDGFNKKEFYTYGIGTKKFLNYFDGQKTEYHVDKEDWKKYREGQIELLKHTKWIKTIPWEAQTFLENQLKRFTDEFPKNLKILTNNDLLQLQKKAAQEVGWTNSRTWMIYLINDVIADKVRTELSKKVSNQARVEEYMLSFSTPLEMNDAMKERVALLLLKIERNILTKEDFADKLNAHTERFKHIPMFGFDHKPYTKKDFENNLNEIENPLVELEKLTSTIETRQTQFKEELKNLNLESTDKLFDLIQMLKHTVFVRDYRDTLRQKMYLLDRYMYEEIGKRLGSLTAEQATNLTNEEVAEGLLGETNLDFKKLAKKRENAFLIIQDDYEIKVYSGTEAKQKADEELGLEMLENLDTIEGTPASKGTARGPARIIQTNTDLHKIQTGDVMISQMTRQDFVPAMKKCVAIVTDEGSITNHAAIVSREFGLPCVVGVKNATSILKDGDIIEVNANKGIVKKI